ncbi:hypothetical protein GGR50DRAFT_632934 [Xylaria sp. CBS 124048]|nr:hypothetical protein GGR50DRAFT_632934 [Xylaria sp. CBS 124048]
MERRWEFTRSTAIPRASKRSFLFFFFFSLSLSSVLNSGPVGRGPVVFLSRPTGHRESSATRASRNSIAGHISVH